MGNHISALFSTAVFAAFCGTASAYTLTGTVKNGEGQIVEGAKVALLNLNQSATTDNEGKFTIHEDEEGMALRMAKRAGSFSLNNGILSFSQGNAPIQVKVFDMMGNQVFNKTLQGNGSINLNAATDAQGQYIARIKMGSAQESVRFTASSNHSGSFGLNSSNAALHKEVAPGGEPLQVTADGYDTLNIKLPTLDTAIDLKLTKAISEETFAFGYALKNAPRPSKGCGTNSTLQSTGQNSNAKKYSLNSAGLNREFWITLPQNYDNNKPYKILFAMHCMGSNAEDFTNHIPDQDHPSPYYGQQNLDKENNYIFVAPRGDTDGSPWRTQDNKDHIFFDELLTLLEENYCIDTSRVFVTGFSFGSMYTNSLAQVFQHRIRAVVTYAVADWNIYIPTNAGKPIAWMDVHGSQDNLCSYDRVNSSVTRILKNNGPNGTDVSDEVNQAQKYSGGNTHVCYDFKKVDPRFPVKLCTWGGGHQWTAYDNGNWQNTWVPEEVHKFFEQF
ncbi:T9SS type A sorting domain-containing protein [uncultured Fibrobacter sp.]|uniref:T9SS type A sorting domain-containing protein n=1 Tax=uncultured Fibrobacter sp. TaxID=261512 RepID=UPI00261AE484|nr:T9SS type A sorting domain-containing protein [uncultured Fibrobacter sp.]